MSAHRHRYERPALPGLRVARLRGRAVLRVVRSPGGRRAGDTDGRGGAPGGGATGSRPWRHRGSDRPGSPAPAQRGRRRHRNGRRPLRRRGVRRGGIDGEPPPGGPGGSRRGAGRPGAVAPPPAVARRRGLAAAHERGLRRRAGSRDARPRLRAPWPRSRPLDDPGRRAGVGGTCRRRQCRRQPCLLVELDSEQQQGAHGRRLVGAGANCRGCGSGGCVCGFGSPHDHALDRRRRGIGGAGFLRVAGDRAWPLGAVHRWPLELFRGRGAPGRPDPDAPHRRQWTSHVSSPTPRSTRGDATTSPWWSSRSAQPCQRVPPA